jgi:hypothetical protein
MARFYTTDPSHPMHAQLVNDERKFYEWVSYNAVLMPGATAGCSTGPSRRAAASRLWGCWKATTPTRSRSFRAFAPTDAEVAARRKANRERAERDWPNVAGIDEGEFRAYAPYNFLHREHRADPPHRRPARRGAERSCRTWRGRASTISASTTGATRSPRTRSSAGRRTYAAFNTGNQRNNQRLGLGLLWHPEMGAVIQSQTGSSTHAGGTRGGDAPTVYEAATVPATFKVGATAVTPEVGARDSAGGTTLLASYDVGRGKKRSSSKAMPSRCA